MIVKEDDSYYQVLDYKSGKRLNWATGREKTYEDLCSDKQLLLYFYALKNMYPNHDFYTSIYYVNDGGIFDIVFSDEDYEKAGARTALGWALARPSTDLRFQFR